MTNYEFAFWLCGFLMLNPDMKFCSENQLHVILNHLNLVKEVAPPLNVDNLWLEEIIKKIMGKKDFSVETMSFYFEKIKKRYALFFKKEIL